MDVKYVGSINESFVGIWGYYASWALSSTLCSLAEYFSVGTKSCIMSVKLTHGYLTTI